MLRKKITRFPWGGSGGFAEITNSDALGGWTIFTSGDNAPGISLSSQGGAAGNGENSGEASGGKGGKGGAAQSVLGSFARPVIATSGSNSPAIHAFSTGASGGRGAKNENTLQASAGGDGGDSGTVAVSGQFNLFTQGDTSPGLWVESVGGEGGVNGNNAADGNGGNADDVTVTLSLDSVEIRTDGALSDGVVARSLGGVPNPNGSGSTTGTAGLAGSVSVLVGEMQRGIVTNGDQSNGITAISRSSNSAVASDVFVSVDLAASVLTNGSGSHGIYTERTAGDSSIPTIPIRVIVRKDGVAQGGSESNVGGVPDGVGVYVVNGGQNTLANAGLITTLRGTDGTAVLYSGPASGSLDIYNIGTITGDVVTDSSGATGSEPTATLENDVGGLVDAGRLVDVRRFDNAGTLAIAGSALGAIDITGDYTQTSEGSLALSLDLTQATPSDRIDRVGVAGAASVDGIVVPTITALDLPAAGEELPFLTGDTLNVAPSLTVQDTAAVDYEHRQVGNELRLAYAVDFASRRILDATNENSGNVARTIETLYLDGTLNDALGLALVNIVDPVDFASGVNSLSAEIALDNQIEGLSASRAFGNSLLSCANASTPLDTGECVYLRATGNHFERDASSDNLGFDATTWGVATGGQRALGNDWYIGGSLAYQNSSLDSSASAARSDGDRLFAGLSGKHVSGPFEFGAAGHVGYGSYDISRNPITGGTVSGTQKQWSASGRLRAAYLHERGDLFFKPRVDLAVDHFFASDFTETGGTNALTVDLGSETYVSLQPALELGATMTGESGTVWRPGLMLGLTQYLGSPGPSLSAAFASNPAVPFSQSTGIDTTHIDLAATLDVFTANAFTFRAEAGASFSENTHAYGGDVKLELRF